MCRPPRTQRVRCVMSPLPPSASARPLIATRSEAWCLISSRPKTSQPIWPAADPMSGSQEIFGRWESE